MTMIDGRKNRKDFMSIVYDTYKDFAENTSIHGLKYTVKKGISVYENFQHIYQFVIVGAELHQTIISIIVDVIQSNAIFWILLIFAGLSGAGYMTMLFWTRYRSNPTRTSILTDYAPNTAVPFPAVTICNINRIMANQVDEFTKRLTYGFRAMPEEYVEVVRRAFPQLLAFTSSSYKHYNMTELNILHNVLVENDYTDIALIMKKITQPCEEMLVKCRWQFETVPCNLIFHDTMTTDGPCCSFNYIREYRDSNRKPIYNPFNGLNSGLQVLLDPNIQPVQHSSLHSSGLKVMVHNPWDYPGSGSIYKIVSAGRQSYLQVSASKIVCSPEIKRLSIEQRQCAYSEEVNLKYFRLYSDTNCLTECEERYLFHKCGCVPFYYPFSTRRFCNITSIPCMDDSVVNIFEGTDNATKTCDCPSQCEDIFYNVLSSTATLEDKTSHSTASFLQDQNITGDSVTLYVYFAGQRQTILYKDIITSTIYLLSSFGGVYSLFLGCSFITIVEIIYYFSFRLVVNLKIVSRIDKTPKKAKEKKQQLKESFQNQKLYNYEGSVFLN